MGRNALALALFGFGLAACGGKTPAPVTPTPPAGPVTITPPAKPADGALAGDALYRVDLGPVPPCTAGAPCDAKLVVRALDGYHVNHMYPTKFVADQASAPLVDGTGVFAAKEGDTTGTMTLSLKPQPAGTARISAHAQARRVQPRGLRDPSGFHRVRRAGHVGAAALVRC